MKLEPMDIRSALQNPPPELDFILPGLQPASVGTVVGAGGVGKTTFLLQLAACCGAGHSGHPLQSRTPTPGRVVYLAAEESRDVLGARLHAISQALMSPTGFPPDDVLALLEENLCILPASGREVHLVRHEEPTAFLDQMEETGEGARLIIIDPLRRLHDGEENSSAVMTQVVQVLESLAKRTGAAVLVAHHMNKGAGFYGTNDAASASRGSSALTDAVRWQINLSPMSEQESKSLSIDSERNCYVRLDYAKTNYAPPRPSLWLKRDSGGVLREIDIQRGFTSIAKKAPSKDRSRHYV